MKRANTFFAVLLVALVALFVAGLMGLFRLRMESGEIYPPYSSLRTDPVGAKALYESLDQVRGFQVVRNYRQMGRLREAAGTTLFLLGADEDDFEEWGADWRTALDPFVKDGGRVVISFFPAHEGTTTGRRAVPPTGKPPASKKPKTREENVKAAWQFDFVHDKLPVIDGVAGAVKVTRDDDSLPLPESLLWHSSLGFTTTGDEWNTVYSRGSNAVVISRKLGAGEIILVSDSYFASNEALRKDRQPALLAWLAGPNRRLLFDETHLGTVEEPGIATLARQYRLHGVLAGLLLLAVLFIWKNTTTLVPRHEDLHHRAEAAVIAGRDSTSGFTNLLRRTIPPREVLTVCLEEWKRSVAGTKREFMARFPRVEAVIRTDLEAPIHQRDPVRTYQEVCRILSERK